MKHFAFALAALAATVLALTACSKVPQASSQSASVAASPAATPPAAAAQPSQPPCGTMCQAGYISLQLTGLANFGSAKQNEFSAPLIIGTAKDGKALEPDKGHKHPVLLTADWWTDGGNLQLLARTGMPAMAWSPFGDKKRDTPPATGTEIPAGWYVSEIWCASKQCGNVTLTVDGKPVVPYSIPWHQP